MELNIKNYPAKGLKVGDHIRLSDSNMAGPYRRVVNLHEESQLISLVKADADGNYFENNKASSIRFNGSVTLISRRNEDMGEKVRLGDLPEGAIFTYQNKGANSDKEWVCKEMGKDLWCKVIHATICKDGMVSGEFDAAYALYLPEEKVVIPKRHGKSKKRDCRECADHKDNDGPCGNIGVNQYANMCSDFKPATPKQYGVVNHTTDGVNSSRIKIDPKTHYAQQDRVRDEKYFNGEMPTNDFGLFDPAPEMESEEYFQTVLGGCRPTYKPEEHDVLLVKVGPNCTYKTAQDAEENGCTPIFEEDLTGNGDCKDIDYEHLFKTLLSLTIRKSNASEKHVLDIHNKNLKEFMIRHEHLLR